MFDSLLQTKLYAPPAHLDWVERPRLLEKLARKRPRKLILVSAPAGYGKTTLVTAWLRQQETAQACWLSLNEDDSDPQQFFRYLAAAVRPLPDVQSSLPQLLQANQTLPAKTLMKAFVHDVAAVAEPFILVLDDYHAIDSVAIDEALAVLLDLMPPQMTLVLASRIDPGFPISRLRARGELIELRADELRFTEAEAAQFLQQTMGLALQPDQIAALESRTEGWIAGLQLAAISLQGHQGDIASFIDAFTGSHRFVLDYLLEEVLQQLPADILTFLLRTSILERMCGLLCDAVVGRLGIRDWRLKGDNETVENLQSPVSNLSGQEILEYLEQANLFIVPLDNERRWYRYHHLFADLLRQRLQQQEATRINALHTRASIWYEANGLEIEAFHHAAAAHDIERAARLVEGNGMPLIFRGAAAPVLSWLATLPPAVLDARPSLWVIYASAYLFANQIDGVEEKLHAAEAALANAVLDETAKDLIGHIAAIRATIAVIHTHLETIIFQSRRALDYLHPDNLPVRTATTWTLGVAYQLQGDRTAASQAYTEAIAISQKIGHVIITFMSTIGLGGIQEADNQLHLAAQTYREALTLAGEPLQTAACVAYLGLARIYYQWNDLETAEQYGQQSVELARLIEDSDRLVVSELFLARLKLAQGNVSGASAILAKAEQTIRQHNFGQQLPEVTAVKLLILIQQGNLEAAAQLVETYNLPLSQARVQLAQRNPAAALAVLAPLRQQVEASTWQDERLKVMILQAMAYEASGDGETAVQLLGDALALAEPNGFIRLFVDEGQPMAALLTRIQAKGSGQKAYLQQLLAAIVQPSSAPSRSLVEPLSQRELEVLQLIAQGLSNREIGDTLFLALDTIKGHNRRIYGKLHVQRRTEAIARARELGLV